MKLWGALYLMIWVVFLDIWLALTPVVPPVPTLLHMLVGLLIVGLAYRNFTALRATTAPGRIKRIARATLYLTLLMAPLGVWTYLGIGAGWMLLLGVSVLGLVAFAHFVNAMAILTQAAATAIAYDMWEEREFAQETAPGEVPEMVPPGGPRGHGPSA